MDEREKTIQQLKRIGLKQKAAEVYAVLLERKGASPSRIAECARLNRSTAYKILVELSIKGLISELKKGRKLYYQIESPKRLIKFAEDQIRLANERLVNVKKAWPDLISWTKVSPVRPRISYADGLPGLMDLYESHVLEKEPYEMLGISNVEKLMGIFPKKFMLQYIDKKKKLGITGRAIFPDSKVSRGYVAEFYKNYPKKILPRVKYVPVDSFSFDSEITIFGQNKVSLINFKAADTVGVIIEDQTIHNMMKMIFELAWEGIKRRALTVNMKGGTL